MRDWKMDVETVCPDGAEIKFNAQETKISARHFYTALPWLVPEVHRFREISLATNGVNEKRVQE
jgi:hypothetical protein